LFEPFLGPSENRLNRFLATQLLQALARHSKSRHDIPKLLEQIFGPFENQLNQFLAAQ